MPAPAIDPEIAAVLAQFPTTLGSISADTLQAVRDQQVAALAAVTLSDAVTRLDHSVPGRDGSGEVVVTVHTPAGLDGPAPCVYFIHGGGYILGHRSMDDLRLDRWCPRLGFIGVSVEYRLAPETPYPGPLEDCYDGLRWVFDHAAELGVDPARIGIAGTSAGGGLAAALALLARERGEPAIAFQLLAYPMLDDRQTTTSSSWDVPIWTPENNTFGWRSYLGDLYGSERVPATAAPSRADDLSGLPPALVFVGTMDGFCDEDVLYAVRLYQSGVPTTLHVYPGAPHGFDLIASSAGVAQRCERDTLEWLDAALAGRFANRSE